jgi:hypothetical protein
VERPGVAAVPDDALTALQKAEQELTAKLLDLSA